MLSFAILPLLENAGLGALLGLMVGGGLTVAWDMSSRGLVLDVILGAIGFAGGVLASATVQYENMTTVHEGNTVIRTTTMHYQHPYFIGFLIAAVLVTLHEMARHRRAKSQPNT
jgi:hypothetical protein